MSQTGLVSCPNCGESVYVGPDRAPLKYVRRAADAYSPRSLLIIGGDWLIHRCIIGA